MTDRAIACKAGHPWDESNNYRDPQGKRHCRVCTRERQRRRWRQAAEAEGRAVALAPGLRTHCPAGHPYDAENTYITPTGTRSCKACRLARQRVWWAAQPQRTPKRVPKAPVIDLRRIARHADLPGERWRPVVGYEGLYDVSDLGRVRSLAHGYGLMKARKTGRYLSVTLIRDGESRSLRVHRLVGEAFIGPLPKGNVTRHGPGGSLDNRLVNLCYGTPAENIEDQVRDGTAARLRGTLRPLPVLAGSENLQAKLTEHAVAECRARYAAGESQAALAVEFSVSRATMGRAVTGRTWATADAGAAPVTERAKPDRCPRGHPYTPDNTVRRKDGGLRRCRECKREYERASRAQRKVRQAQKGQVA